MTIQAAKRRGLYLSKIVLGCDSNGINDHGWQNTVAKALQKAGHDVTKLNIGPNYFATQSYSKKSKGKIGIFLIAPAIFAIADCYSGNTYFKYAYFGIRGDCDKGLKSESDFKTKPIHRDSDCTSICNKLDGKNFVQINEIVKNKCQAVFGATPEEMGRNLVNAMGGSTSQDGSSKSDNYSSIKESLREVLSAWDGDVECFIRDDTVHVQKIGDPTSAKLSLIESQDVFYDSVTVTDVNPSTVNHLKVTYGNHIITVQDASLIKRFGKISSTISASDCKTLKEAQSFARREWSKLRRDNGHQLECKVLGNLKWKVGQWCRVYLPSFGIDDYMYIIKVSQEETDGNWVCGLTLVDYPPSLGEPEEEENTEKQEEANQ